MKAIITIIILALVVWAIWWFAGGGPDETDLGTGDNVPNTAEVQGANDVNLDEFQDKG